MQTVIVIN